MESLSKLFAKDSVLGNLASSYATGLANNASKPKSIIIQSPTPIASSSDDSGSSKKYLMIGGGVIALIILILALKGRK
jgi:hypothetical protein